MSLDSALRNYQAWINDLDKTGASWYWKKHAFSLDATEISNRLQDFRNIESKPLSDTLDDYRSKMSMQEMFEKVCLRVPENLVEQLLENKVGNPPAEKVRMMSGREVNATFNDLILISFAVTIFNALSEKQKNKEIRVLEIGGGYGGLAAKLKILLPLAKFTIIDIPHAGVLQTYYLTRIHSEKDVAVVELKDANPTGGASFLIVPNSRKDFVESQRFDLAINSRSFMEMDQVVIQDYFDLIQQTLNVDGIFFNCNRLWKNAGDKPTQISKYPYDNFWDLISMSTSFFQANTIEIIARRSKIENALFKTLIRRLPKTDFLIHRLKFQGFVEWLRPYVPTVLTFTYWKKVRKF